MNRKIKRLLKSFGYAISGIIKTFKEEQNLQIQVIIGIIIILVSFLLRIKLIEFCFILSSIFLIIIMEMINSAIERVTDVLKPRIHTYVKDIKDIMAGAVFISSVLAIIIGLIIFIPYLLKFLNK